MGSRPLRIYEQTMNTLPEGKCEQSVNDYTERTFINRLQNILCLVIDKSRKICYNKTEKREVHQNEKDLL